MQTQQASCTRPQHTSVHCRYAAFTAAPKPPKTLAFPLTSPSLQHGVSPAKQLGRLPEVSVKAVESQIDQTAPLYTTFSSPVYSLSTLASSPNSRDTMNLVTYASPVAIKPDRCFAIGLYLGTQSWENFKQHRRGVLQILQEQHAPLFQLLGKTSATKTDKLAAIAAQEQITQRLGHPTLQGAACVMLLEAISDFLPCGDHDVVLCKVVEFQNLTAEPRVLSTGYLRQHGYI